MLSKYLISLWYHRQSRPSHNSSGRQRKPRNGTISRSDHECWMVLSQVLFLLLREFVWPPGVHFATESPKLYQKKELLSAARSSPDCPLGQTGLSETSVSTTGAMAWVRLWSNIKQYFHFWNNYNFSKIKNIQQGTGWDETGPVPVAVIKG